MVGLRLRAEVTMPDMEISTDTLDFGDVKCGECKVITVQLYNHKHVRCSWTSQSNEKEKQRVSTPDLSLWFSNLICSFGTL